MNPALALYIYLKANLHAAICQPDLSATINREANRFNVQGKQCTCIFYSQNFLMKRLGKQNGR